MSLPMYDRLVFATDAFLIRTKGGGLTEAELEPLWDELCEAYGVESRTLAQVLKFKLADK